MNKFGYNTWIIEDNEGNAFYMSGYFGAVVLALMEDYGYDFYAKEVKIYEV